MWQRDTQPDMCMTALNVSMHISAVNNWELHQVNIVTVFLQGDLEAGEKMYMEQLKGFEVAGKEHDIWQLKKGLYGTPQGLQVWNRMMNQGMLTLGFS